MLSNAQPIMSMEQMEQVTGGEEDAMMALKQVNARKPLVGLYGALDSMKSENIGGLVAVLTRGEMGLKAAEPEPAM